MSKTICKTTDKAKLEEKQAEENYQCKRCGEKASKEKYVCKPEKIADK
ncbi:hypothetical protein [Paludibacter jiangxiensis]|uniref:Uncharacterized protein n=1 Tax=Paludibacter jiangxiensis TaxID=681398 RepID=A0A170ZWI7_9BACT|nr:hypothetical protein [Paludibacter jiangxiensis]MDP4203141.1 hypothetical protein [Bacteroidota bacterium]GAT63082.1 hypothetical protein PJIAN_3394 [Paludibacter jiangxiensis]